MPWTNRIYVEISENSLILLPPLSIIFILWESQIGLTTFCWPSKEKKKSLPIMFSPTTSFSSGLIYLSNFEHHLNFSFFPLTTTYSKPSVGKTQIVSLFSFPVSPNLSLLQYTQLLPKAKQAASLSSRVETCKGGVKEAENVILSSFRKDRYLQLTLMAAFTDLWIAHLSFMISHPTCLWQSKCTRYLIWLVIHNFSFKFRYAAYTFSLFWGLNTIPYNPISLYLRQSPN